MGLLYIVVSLTSCPVVSSGVFIVFVGLSWLLVRKWRRARLAGLLALLVPSLVLTLLTAPLIHGNRLGKYIVYEVPLILSVTPSDEALATFHGDSSRTSSAWWDEDDSGQTGGDFGMPLRPWDPKTTPAGQDRPSFTQEVKVHYRHRFYGYLRFQSFLGAERIIISNHSVHQRRTKGGQPPSADAGIRYLAIPIRRGERNFRANDSYGYEWRIRTQTLNGKARFVTVEYSL